MAQLYLARKTGIGDFERHVVIKVIAPERASDDMSIRMFLDEARLAASLHHNNVAQVIEVGAEGNLHYFVMEYVHGQDLRAILARCGELQRRIPLEIALFLVASAAAGLHHAHERCGPDGVHLKIVHRDVSPSNVMVGYDGSVKLVDFGIAKAAERSAETQAGTIKGKFAYMSPEQCRGKDLDHRSDIFALGIVLYEATTQQRAFRADSDFETMQRIVSGTYRKPSLVYPGFPPELEAIIDRCLQVNPDHRYQHAGELAEAIESFAAARRLPLSAMAVTRFMKDLFGDIAEPWVQSRPMMAAVPAPREQTVSNIDVRPAKFTLPPSARAEGKAAREPVASVVAPRGHEPVGADGEGAHTDQDGPTVPVPRGVAANAVASMSKLGRDPLAEDADTERHPGELRVVAAPAASFPTLQMAPEEARRLSLASMAPQVRVSAAQPQVLNATVASAVPPPAAAPGPALATAEANSTAPVADLGVLQPPVIDSSPRPVVLDATYKLKTRKPMRWVGTLAALAVGGAAAWWMFNDPSRPEPSQTGRDAPNAVIEVLHPADARTVDAAEIELPVEPMTSDGPAPRVDAPMPVVVADAPTVTPPVRPGPEYRTVMLESAPRGAKVYAGRRLLGRTPLPVRIEEGKRMTVRVVAEDFREREVTLFGDGNKKQRVDLERRNYCAPGTADYDLVKCSRQSR